jgi:hypothetical protein
MPPVRSGFKVGPANLPDGTYRRKGKSTRERGLKCSNTPAVKKIKAHLIHKAQLKRDFARLKSRVAATEDAAPAADKLAVTLDPHPDRQALMDDDDDEEEKGPPPPKFRRQQHRHQRPEPRGSPAPANTAVRRPKADPFAPQSAEAARRQSAAEERARRREEAAAAKTAAIAERERVQRLVARARKPGRDGRRRLGREGALLLDKVKKLVGSG